ncbi:sulfite exporter TauE/SafE family protein [Pararhizobium sp. A13]|uniref:sulfite exporter TauE/SafE family protein n=1 Tax=Pararhizobium sp. A13 TaxID=3133975 RepID=UPI00311B194A
MSDPLTLTAILSAGLLMGLGGSLHCAGQCGGIASSLLIATGRGSSGPETAKALLATQLGRTVTYTIAGGLVGVAGGALGDLLDLAGIQPLLRILGGVMLVWVGLALIGVVPGPQIFDRRAMAVSGRMFGRNPPSAIRGSSALLLGMAWGAAPCAMVYNALMTAMLTGAPATGALFMMGFGLATIPAVALAALGMSQIAIMGFAAHCSARRKAIGLAIAFLGLASMAMPAVSLGALCMN